MQHTFFQKLILTALAGALVAVFYVYVYEGIILGADKAVDGSFSKPAAAARATPRRF